MHRSVSTFSKENLQDYKVPQQDSLRNIIKIDVMQSLRRGLNQPLESWDGIKNCLIEVINTDKDIEREFFALSTAKLGQEVKNGEQFFQTLENSFGEHFHVVEFLINLTEEVSLHVDDGSTKVADDLRQYIDKLKEYDIKLSEKCI